MDQGTLDAIDHLNGQIAAVSLVAEGLLNVLPEDIRKKTEDNLRAAAAEASVAQRHAAQRNRALTPRFFDGFNAGLENMFADDA